MNKVVRVILLDNAKLEYQKLNEIVNKQTKDNTEEIQLLRCINNKKELIKVNPFYGNNIEKKKIPHFNNNIQNLWRVQLTGYWRMLYTIKGNESEIICFIIEILNHKKYNKLFGYK